jgi:O-antigen/teichoic acid export membrane protein
VLKYIFKNSSYLLISQFLVKVLAFGYAIFLAGNIGASDFGTYSAALSIFGLMSLFADLGINRVLTRDIARDPEKLGKLFSTALLLRAFSSALSFLGLTAFFYLTDPSNLRFSLTAIALLSLVPQSVALSIDAVLIAVKKASVSALGFFLFNMVSFITGALLIYLGFGVYGAMTAFLIGHIFYAIFFVLGLILLKKIKFTPFDWGIAKTILVKSLPYGILSAIGFASFRFDTVILSFSRGGTETGIYSLAYRFLEAATIIPVAFGTILYPVFSEIGKDAGKTRKLFQDSLFYGFSAGMILVLAYWSVLPWFLNTFFPESFRGASAALKILSLSLPFIFMHIPLGQLLLSKEHLLKKMIAVYLFIFTVNLALMLYLIPLYGLLAAACITVFNEVLTFITFLIVVNKKVLN